MSQNVVDLFVGGFIELELRDTMVIVGSSRGCRVAAMVIGMPVGTVREECKYRYLLLERVCEVDWHE